MHINQIAFIILGIYIILIPVAMFYIFKLKRNILIKIIIFIIFILLFIALFITTANLLILDNWKQHEHLLHQRHGQQLQICASQRQHYLASHQQTNRFNRQQHWWNNQWRHGIPPWKPLSQRRPQWRSILSNRAKHARQRQKPLHYALCRQ